MMDSPESRATRQTHGPEAVDEFLDSNPELSSRLGQLRLLGIDNALRERKAIRGILLKSVQKSLAAKADDNIRKWMSELAGFNYDTDYDAEFIAALLLDHAIERPWIIETPFMDNVAHILIQDGAEPKFFRSSLCTSHTDCRVLSILVQRHGGRHRNLWTVTLPHMPQKPQCENLVFDIDSHLGIAGVIPLEVRNLLPAVHRRGQGLSSNNVAVFKQTFLREFQSHVNFEHLSRFDSSYRARVSFQSEDEPFGRLVDRISHMIRQLESALSRCQANGQCLLGIPFLMRTASTSKDPVLSMATLSIEDLNRFTHSFEKLGEACRQRDTNPAVALSVGATTLSVLLMPFTFGLSGALVAGAVGAAGAAVSAYNRDATSKRLQEAMEQVSRTLAVIFCVIGLDFVDSEMSVSLPVILHYSSLAVQCLSLAIQFSVRGFLSPIDFSFLENDVGEFILEGTNSGPKIFAASQPLTCLGDMLRQDVLVFGLYQPIQSVKMDLVACVEDVLSVWGPGKLELVPRGLDGDHSSSYIIGKISIGGGTLRPHSESVSLPLWHWNPGDTHDDRLSLDDEVYGNPVGLRTKIRIGVIDVTSPAQVHLYPATSTPNITCPLSFTPIGPGRENNLCPHSSWEFNNERRRTMGELLKNIGTHEEYDERAGHEIGAQGGQYVGGNIICKWERRRGFAEKASLLDEKQKPSDLIAKLDEYCGLFVSSCTRVMARARLRDLIAFAGPMLYPELFPILGGLSLQDSKAELVRVLQSQDNFFAWADGRRDDQGKVLINSDKFKDLILSVLRKLKSTGVTPPNAFEVAWISPDRRPPQATRVSCASDPWLYLFKDGEHTATFACATPVCLETQFHACAGRRDEPPHCSLSLGLSDFTLSTRVLPYQDLPSGPAQQLQGTRHYATLRHGEKYLLNLATAKITAKVEEAFPWGYRIKLDEEKVITRFVKRLIARQDARLLRESNNDLAFPCLISGGS